MQNNIPYLCGGVFFALLLEARKGRSKARNKFEGGTDGLSEKDIMKDLIYVVTGERIEVIGDSFAKATSQYKTCQITDCTYIPFNNASTITTFNDAIETKNSDITNRMSEFIDKYLNTEKSEWLVKALIDTIKNDDTITRFDEFNIDTNRKVSKYDLLSIDNIYLPAFLLSILQFILKNHRNNDNGKQTFNAWFSRKTKYGKWVFTSDIGSGITQRIIVSNTYHEIMGNRKNPFTQNAQINALTQNNTNLLDSEGQVESKKRFANYIDKISSFYKKIKTLLYSEQPREFYDFYVCNDLRLNMKSIHKTYEVLSNVTANILEEKSKHIIIEGTGGIGKTMMMKHLLFDGVKEYQNDGRIPVLMYLKNFSVDCPSIFEFVWASIYEFDNTINRDDITKMLIAGKFILLFDGLDEVPTSARSGFETMLTAFVKQYSRNLCILSSRPTSSFISYSLFSIYEILPFDKTKALELVDKLEYHDVDAKAKFRDDLNRRLFNSHHQFASNPLLLTIMLMTYTSYGDIPAKRHIFYSKAYETMARLHDASKGAYVRPMYTKLTPEDFALLFSEFCARTYKADTLEFTAETFVSYMNKVLSNSLIETKASAYDFLKDLTDNLCIMYKEGEKYYFIHRSFQEYFTAVYFSKQMDDKFAVIGDFFENKKNRILADKTFDMLYDMVPDKIDRYVFLPLLESLWKRCDEKNGFWTFMLEMYSVFFSSTGDAGRYYINNADSYLYDFVTRVNQLSHTGELDDLEWPSDADPFKTDWVLLESEEIDLNGVTHVIRRHCEVDEIPPSYIFEHGDPNVEGSSWEIDMDTVLNDEQYDGLKYFMLYENFPLFNEYMAMREYTKTLRERIDSKHLGTDWFENF